MTFDPERAQVDLTNALRVINLHLTRLESDVEKGAQTKRVANNFSSQTMLTAKRAQKIYCLVQKSPSL